VPLTQAGQIEADFIRTEPPYLRLVWHNANWRLYVVRSPTPIVSGPAHLLAATASSLTLRAPAGANVRIIVNWSRWLRLTGDSGACISPTPEGFVRLHTTSSGTFRVDSSLWPPHRSCP
jgi:hypothetical protein